MKARQTLENGPKPARITDRDDPRYEPTEAELNEDMRSTQHQKNWPRRSSVGTRAASSTEWTPMPTDTERTIEELEGKVAALEYYVAVLLKQASTTNPNPESIEFFPPRLILFRIVVHQWLVLPAPPCYSIRFGVDADDGIRGCGPGNQDEPVPILWSVPCESTTRSRRSIVSN